MLAEATDVDGFKLEGVKNKLVNEKLNLMKEYNLELPDIDFELSDFSLEELRSKFEEIVRRKS